MVGKVQEGGKKTKKENTNFVLTLEIMLTFYNIMQDLIILNCSLNTTLINIDNYLVPETNLVKSIEPSCVKSFSSRPPC